MLTHLLIPFVGVGLNVLSEFLEWQWSRESQCGADEAFCKATIYLKLCGGFQYTSLTVLEW